MPTRFISRQFHIKAETWENIRTRAPNNHFKVLVKLLPLVRRRSACSTYFVLRPYVLNPGHFNIPLLGIDFPSLGGSMSGKRTSQEGGGGEREKVGWLNIRSDPTCGLNDVLYGGQAI